MASTPDIAVRIRAEGIAKARATFKALQASATRSFALVEKGASQARATLSAIEKPVELTIGGVAKIARMTALVGTLAAALAGLEVGKDLDAGNAVTSMKAGIGVAIDRTAELKSQITDVRKQMADLPQNSDMFGVLRSRAEALETQLAATRNASKMVDDQWRKNVATANRLGVEIEKVGPGYVQLANATKGTALAGEQTNKIFESTLKTSRALGLSADKTSSGMTAIAQVAAKQKWSAEEAQQLAEAGIPAAKILQNELGLTSIEFAKLQERGISAEVALSALARGMEKQFGSKAAELANGPAAAFARLKNSIFLARAEVANGGMAKGLAVIADSVRAVIDRLAASGQLAVIGQRIGAALANVPALFAAISREVGILRAYTTEWWRQMLVAIGVDTTGWADRTSAAFAWVRQTLLQLAFDIPGVIYALRQAFAGNDGNVGDRYAWVLPLRDFIQNQLMPLLAKVPGMVEKWLPIFVGVAGTIVSIMGGIRDTMVAVFGEEGANKIAAFLIIGRFTGMLSAIAGAMGFVSTAVSALVGTFNLLKTVGLALFTPPAGLIIAGIAAVAALAYVVYKNWDSIKAFLVGIWDSIAGAVTSFVTSLKEIWDGLAVTLKAPFELAKKAISAILDGLMKAIEYSPAGLLFKGGKYIVEHASKAVGYATGGMIRGAGSGTSDSIPIWASNGEGMINARATSHYGGQRFIDSVNQMKFGGFRAPADVVEVSSSQGRPLSLAIPGFGAASGMGDDRLADSLERLFGRAAAGRGRQSKPRGYR